MNIKIALKAFVLIMSVLFLNGCSNDDYLTNKNGFETVTSLQTAKLSLNCKKQGFESNGANTRATSTTTWQEGDKIYLRFSNGATTTQGNAVYKASEDAWYINYYGTLTRDKEMNVEVYYFENPESVTEEEVKLSPTSAVFHDAEAKYIYPSGGDLTVTTNLSPTTSRVRFKGDSGTKFSMSGISYCRSFNIVQNSFQELDSIIDVEINEDGYSRYIYGVKNKCGILYLLIGNWLYKKGDINSILKIGKSGWIQLPTLDTHEGWLPEDVFGGQEYVDLGLPSGNLWARCNLGTTIPEEVGLYYCWGETTGEKDMNHRQKSWQEYSLCNGSEYSLIKYCTDPKYGEMDNKIILESVDDAATTSLSHLWHIPTEKDFCELFVNCSWKSINNGIAIMATGKNGNTIVFPNPREYVDSRWNNYWTSELNANECRGAYAVQLHTYSSNNFANDNVTDISYDTNRDSRTFYRNIRPVCNKRNVWDGLKNSLFNGNTHLNE